MQENMKSDLVDIDAVIIYETVKAYLVDYGGKAHVWVPKSQCEFYPEDGGYTGVITLPERLAIEKEMI